MNASSVDIADIIASDSALALTLGTTLFVGKEPTKPDNIVTVIDTPGFPPQLTLAGQGENYYYPSVQIRVRNRDYRTGWQIIQDIVTLLHGRNQEVWNGTLYSVIYCASGPALLDWDDNMLCRFIANFNLQRR